MHWERSHDPPLGLQHDQFIERVARDIIQMGFTLTFNGATPVFSIDQALNDRMMAKLEPILLHHGACLAREVQRQETVLALAEVDRILAG